MYAPWPVNPFTNWTGRWECVISWWKLNGHPSITLDECEPHKLAGAILLEVDIDVQKAITFDYLLEGHLADNGEQLRFDDR